MQILIDGQPSSKEQKMVKKSSIKVATASKGAIKPLHSVGQPPILGWADYSMFHYLKEIGVKYSRLHDTGGAFGKGIYVDIPNLFRDFDANPYDPASYDFAFTDRLLQSTTTSSRISGLASPSRTVATSRRTGSFRRRTTSSGRGSARASSATTRRAGPTDSIGT